ncbi:hypothetical protein Tco_0974619 [Tanacetum coccineum]|uniref:Uncharacterized protein n=1 Tax=Tanacetum coccineum TaxID=301880 RepID=A0ABQ5ED76_9ASTR
MNLIVLYVCLGSLFDAQKERNPRKDRGTTRGRHSTSSYSTFGQPSSSHFNDDDDGNDEGTSRASTPSPIRYDNSLTNEVPYDFPCSTECRGDHCRPYMKSDFVYLNRLLRSKMSFHQALDLIFELDEYVGSDRERSSNNAQDSLAFCPRSLHWTDWLLVRLCGGLSFSHKRFDLEPKFVAMTRSIWSKSLNRVHLLLKWTLLDVVGKHQDVRYGVLQSFPVEIID